MPQCRCRPWPVLIGHCMACCRKPKYLARRLRPGRWPVVVTYILLCNVRVCVHCTQCTYSSVLPALCSLIREEEGGQSTGKDQWAKVGLYIYISAPPVLSILAQPAALSGLWPVPSFWTLMTAFFWLCPEQTSLYLESDDRSLLALYDFWPGRSFWTLTWPLFLDSGLAALSGLGGCCPDSGGQQGGRGRGALLSLSVCFSALRALHNCFRSLSLLPTLSRIFRPTSAEKRPLPKQKCTKMLRKPKTLLNPSI